MANLQMQIQPDFWTSNAEMQLTQQKKIIGCITPSSKHKKCYTPWVTTLLFSNEGTSNFTFPIPGQHHLH